MPANPICVALDTPDLDRAVALARSLKPHAGYMKVGMEFFYAHGIQGYAKVAGVGLPIFLDLKLHDIPNTVASAMKSLMRLEPKPVIVNVHATGGLDMMKAAADAVAGQAS
jgi:orotidine-5'-phosphate decarboxylase